jgi:predicted permease
MTEQVVILFVFMVIGFVLAKTKVVNEEKAQVLSAITVYALLPAKVFKTFRNDFTVEYLSKNYSIIISSVVILVILALITALISKLFTKNKYEQYIYSYSMTVPNYGYMGYALAESILGSAGLVKFMTFGIPFSIYIYAVSIAIFTKTKFNIKTLLNIPVLSTVAGVVAGLINLPVHKTVLTICDSLGGCVAPVTMLLAGIVISTFNIKEVLGNKWIYVATVLKLIVIPLCVGYVLIFAGFNEVAPIAALFCSLPCGLNSIVFPKLINENCKIGAGLTILSSILFLVTVPFVLNLFNI